MALQNHVLTAIRYNLELTPIRILNKTLYHAAMLQKNSDILIKPLSWSYCGGVAFVFVTQKSDGLLMVSLKLQQFMLGQTASLTSLCVSCPPSWARLIRNGKELHTGKQVSKLGNVTSCRHFEKLSASMLVNVTTVLHFGWCEVHKCAVLRRLLLSEEWQS